VKGTTSGTSTSISKKQASAKKSGENRIEIRVLFGRKFHGFDYASANLLEFLILGLILPSPIAQISSLSMFDLENENYGPIEVN